MTESEIKEGMREVPADLISGATGYAEFERRRKAFVNQRKTPEDEETMNLGMPEMQGGPMSVAAGEAITPEDFIHPDDVLLNDDLTELLEQSWTAMRIALGSVPFVVMGVKYLLDATKTEALLRRHLDIDDEAPMPFNICLAVDGGKVNGDEPVPATTSIGYLYKGEPLVPNYVQDPGDDKDVRRFTGMPSLKQLMKLAMDMDTPDPKFYAPMGEDAEPNGRPVIDMDVYIINEPDDKHPSGTIFEAVNFDFSKLDPDVRIECQPSEKCNYHFTTRNPFAGTVTMIDGIPTPYSALGEDADDMSYNVCKVFFLWQETVGVDVHFFGYAGDLHMDEGEVKVVDAEGLDISKMYRAFATYHGTEEIVKNLSVAVDPENEYFYLAPDINEEDKLSDLNFFDLSDIYVHAEAARIPVDVHLWIRPIEGVVEDGHCIEMPVDFKLNLKDVIHVAVSSHGIVFGEEEGSFPKRMKVNVILDTEANTIDFPDNDGEPKAIFLHGTLDDPAADHDENC